MSARANHKLPIVTTVTKTTTKEKAPKETDAAPRVNIQDFCEEHYEDILSVIMEKIRHDKRKEVHTRLDFGDNTKRSRRTRESSQNSSAGTRQSAFNRLNDTYSPSTTKPGPDRTSSRDHSQSRRRPYRRDSPLSRDRSRSKDRSRGVETHMINTTPHIGQCYQKRGTEQTKEARYPVSKRHKLIDEEDLPVPWTCKEVDPFTPRIRNFKSSQKTRMPNKVKTYDRTGDPEDHVKKFQAATQLPSESIDGYKDLKVAFLAYFMQQKKYVKDPVEIHNIKQRDGETLEDFMECFKVEIRRMKGASECMRIFGFMHGVNNLELTKHLNVHIPNTMEEMMTVTTAFIRGETVAASKKKGHAPWKPQD
ncbi:reverse transcriptase domain-containing protein [Tanacetum coccineum]